MPLRQLQTSLSLPPPRLATISLERGAAVHPSLGAAAQTGALGSRARECSDWLRKLPLSEISSRLRAWFDSGGPRLMPSKLAVLKPSQSSVLSTGVNDAPLRLAMALTSVAAEKVDLVDAVAESAGAEGALQHQQLAAVERDEVGDAAHLDVAAGTADVAVDRVGDVGPLPGRSERGAEALQANDRTGARRRDVAVDGERLFVGGPEVVSVRRTTDDSRLRFGRCAPNTAGTTTVCSRAPSASACSRSAGPVSSLTSTESFAALYASPSRSLPAASAIPVESAAD